MAVAEIAWCAGLIDGEDSIRLAINSRCIQPSITVEMTDFETVKRFHRIIKVGYLSQSPSNNPKWKSCLRWEAVSANAIIAVRQLEPFLFTKKPQALLILEYAEKCVVVKGSRPTEQQKILRQILAEEMRELNKKGA